MSAFLAIVSILSYLFAAFAFVLAFSGSDIQFILAGVFATCGTVAATGVAIVNRLDAITRNGNQSPAAEAPRSAPGKFDKAGNLIVEK
jgi:hypothetical protein